MSLADTLDQRHDLYLLANAIDWDSLDASFSALYSKNGRPSHPVRRMAGLLILKQLRGLSDPGVCRFWQESPYAQYFCGEERFQWGHPCADSDLTHFRNRIGEEGAAAILQASIDLHREKVDTEEELVSDTTVQEANIAFPTDNRLRINIIERLWKMADRSGIRWSRSYVRTVPRLKGVLKTRSHRLAGKRRKAGRRLRTIAGRLLREFRRRCPEGLLEDCLEELELMERVLKQRRPDSGKVYSLKDPGVFCIAKGKSHKKYEFGRKASVSVLRDSGIVVGATSFLDNPYDGDALPGSLAEVEAHTGRNFGSCLVDRGYRGRKSVGDTRILLPDDRKIEGSAYLRRKRKRRFDRRSAVEPISGHLKSRFGLGRCMLEGPVGASINLKMAAAAWNLSKWMREKLWLPILQRIFGPVSRIEHLWNLTSRPERAY